MIMTKLINSWTWRQIGTWWQFLKDDEQQANDENDGGDKRW